jgi:aminoglycoside 6-adenylyltransferase
MAQTTHVYEQLIERFAKWAEAQPGIGTAFVIGSQARTTCPADEWSDLDLVATVDKPERYLFETDWLEEMGNPWVTFVEGTGDERERRVLFEGGLDVDFALLARKKIRLLARLVRIRERFPALFRRLPRTAAQQVSQGSAAFSGVARRGTRVLFDKDGVVEHLLQVTAEVPSSHPPTQDEVLNLINDFWYHAVWTAKKLRRGELWTAQGCSDSYLKWRLLRMIEWHARATNGWDYDTWHGGRFLEQWADDRVVQDLEGAFAHYDEWDVWQSLSAMMDLFRWVAVETAVQLGYPYPTSADEHATELVQSMFSERLLSE